MEFYSGLTGKVNLGFGIWDLGFGDLGFGSGIWDPGSGIWDLKFEI
jgi:hypothetical protein